MNHGHVQDAAKAILAARDFCGSEREALDDYCHDYGAPNTPAFRAEAFKVANAEWNRSRREAGVRGA